MEGYNVVQGPIPTPCEVSFYGPEVGVSTPYSLSTLPDRLSLILSTDFSVDTRVFSFNERIF